MSWDSTAKCVRAWNIEYYGSLVLDRKNVADPPGAELLTAFLDGIRKTGFAALGMSRNEQGFRERVTFLHRNGYADQYPDFSEEGLMSGLADWLGPYVSGFKKLDDLKKLNYRTILEGTIAISDLLAMRQLAPEKFEVPSGSHITINYSDPLQPAVSVRLQELFGLKKNTRSRRRTGPSADGYPFSRNAYRSENTGSGVLLERILFSRAKRYERPLSET